MPGSVLGTWSSAVNNIQTALPSWSLLSNRGRQKKEEKLMASGKYRGKLKQNKGGTGDSGDCVCMHVRTCTHFYFK